MERFGSRITDFITIVICVLLLLQLLFVSVLIDEIEQISDKEQQPVLVTIEKIIPPEPTLEEDMKRYHNTEFNFVELPYWDGASVKYNVEKELLLAIAI